MGPLVHVVPSIPHPAFRAQDSLPSTRVSHAAGAVYGTAPCRRRIAPWTTKVIRAPAVRHADRNSIGAMVLPVACKNPLARCPDGSSRKDWEPLFWWQPWSGPASWRSGSPAEIRRSRCLEIRSRRARSSSSSSRSLLLSRARISTRPSPWSLQREEKLPGVAVRPVCGRRQSAGAPPSPRTPGAVGPGRAQRRSTSGSNRLVDR